MKMRDLISIVNESTNPPAGEVFFLRVTGTPERDLERGFSCYEGCWWETKQDALDDQQDHVTLIPRQDPHTQLWCSVPEDGLSAFGFWDEQTFTDAVELIQDYIRSDEVAIFVSNDYTFATGSDGEDLFRNGRFLGYLPIPPKWEEMQKLIPA